MKAANIGLLISTTLGSLLLSFIPATAAILVEPIITTFNENFSDGTELPPNLQPILWNAPDTTGLNLLNNTGYTINKFSLLLLPELDFLEDDLVWGDVNGDGQVGLSNIFTNITTTPDFVFEDLLAPRLEFTDGTIPDGTRFTIQIITSPDLRPANPEENGPLAIGGFYDGFRTVPEPSTILGFTLTMVLVGLCKKMGQN